MFDFNLDKRCLDILNYIIYANGYLNVETIISQFGISKRTAYYDLKKINDFLNNHNIPEFIKERGKGIKASEEQINEIKKLLFKQEQVNSSIFTPKEREEIIICSIILANTPIFTEDFMKLCDVSRNTISTDKKHVIKFLEDNNLRLDYSIKSGYKIIGDEIKIRSLFFLFYPQHINHFMNLFSSSQLNQINLYKMKLKQIEGFLKIEYVTGIIPTLAAYISISRQMDEALLFEDMDRDEIRTTKEFKLIEEYFPELSMEEKIYVSLHLLGSRLQSEPVKITNDTNINEAKKLASLLFNSFKDISGIQFKDEQEVINALVAHMSKSMYRYRYGIQLGNPLLENIKTQYKELFDLTQMAFENISNQISFHISDAEIAYLSLTFGAFMPNDYKLEQPIKIMVICPNGIGTGKMIINEVQRLVPQATEIVNIPLSQYSTDHGYNVVISTIQIPDEKNLIVVNPILTDQDRVSILSKCVQTDLSTKMQIDEIINITRKYIPTEKMNDFEKDIQRLFASKHVSKRNKPYYGLSLINLLTPNHIVVNEDEMTWQNAIIASAEPLLIDDSITQQYIDAIIEDQNNGNYMFLSDDLVLAHSKCENGVKKIDLSISIYKEPVLFANGRQASIILTLAPENQTSHIHMLTEIIQIFSKKKNIEQLIHCNDSYEIYDFFKAQLK